jgi:phosphate starvation-inducible PhoH-like protein
MNNMIKKVKAGNVDKLQRVLGTFDENLNIIMRELAVIVRVEGGNFVVEGAEEDVNSAVSVLESLLTLAENGENVDKAKTLYCIELSREGKAGDITKLSSDTIAITYRGKPIRCKTVGQKRYVDSIKSKNIVFGVGPAGTGKTYLAVCLAVQAIKQKLVEKIILTRPAVEAGEKLGFLPGDLQTKVDPYLRPLYDALQELLGLETYTKFMERGSIEIAPLAYMRGRTLSNAFIILDEAQNTTREQMKMFLTRLGDGSKMVITGDVTQIDLPSGKSSGLEHAVWVLRDEKEIGIINLTDKDVVRNPLVMKIVRAYERDSRRTTDDSNEAD